MERTRHGNLMELCFWVPVFLLPLAAAFYDRRNSNARGEIIIGYFFSGAKFFFLSFLFRYVL